MSNQKGLMQNIDIKVDEQCDARTGNMTKTIYTLAVCRGYKKEC